MGGPMMSEPSLKIFGHGVTSRELTVKEYAAQERVTERTVWNWIEKGAIPVRRTPGGGVRVVGRAVMKSSEDL